MIQPIAFLIWRSRRMCLSPTAGGHSMDDAQVGWIAGSTSAELQAGSQNIS
jgi:hypothetical protein